MIVFRMKILTIVIKQRSGQIINFERALYSGKQEVSSLFQMNYFSHKDKSNGCPWRCQLCRIKVQNLLILRWLCFLGNGKCHHCSGWVIFPTKMMVSLTTSFIKQKCSKNILLWGGTVFWEMGGVITVPDELSFPQRWWCPGGCPWSGREKVCQSGPSPAARRRPTEGWSRHL